MDTETTNGLAPLLPDRHPQHDLFICDVADAVLKDVMQHMEHPFYSLSKKPETTIRRYEHNGHWLEITPSVKGLATIYDKDILIYCISQIMAKLKKNEPVSHRVRISSRDLLVFTNRGTSGRDYMALVEALDRLEGTRIRTNIITADSEQIDGFGLIDASSIRRKHGLDGRLLWCEVKLSDWVFNAVKSREVLTLHRNYFRLRKPLERRLYEIARKHCGAQSEWSIGLDKLKYKCGSNSTDKEFKRLITRIFEEDQEHQHIPDYSLRIVGEKVVFTNRRTMPAIVPEDGISQLDAEVYHDARTCAPGWDVRYLEREWRHWCAKEEIMPKRPESHFLAFCRSWAEKRGRPN